MSLTVTSRILFVYICAYIYYVHIVYIYIDHTKLSQTSLSLSIPPH